MSRQSRQRDAARGYQRAKLSLTIETVIAEGRRIHGRSKKKGPRILRTSKAQPVRGSADKRGATRRRVA